MSSRNYGLRTRDMASAGRIALARLQGSGGCAFATVDALADRWAQFAAFAKAAGVGRMERIDRELVAAYGRDLAARVEAGELASSTAQNRLSAVNTVMRQVTDWTSVRPVHDCHIAERDNVRHEPPPDRDQATAAIEQLRAAGLERQAAIAELAHTFGLRSKEASLLDAAAAQAEARGRGAVTIQDGTKGGREREIPITAPAQLEALARAAEIQSGARNLVPAGHTWAEWRAGGLREGREALREALGGGGYHELRAGYACGRYEALTGQPAPCSGARIEDRDADLDARAVIAEELGHGRIDVLASYVGGRR